MKSPTSPVPEPTARGIKVDLMARVETSLAHPVAKVWPYILHWNLWVDEKDYAEHRVAGSPDTEGEMKRITHFDETGRMDSSFFVTAIEIVPNAHLVYKILSPSYAFDASTGASTEIPMTGYEIFDLHEENGQTVVRFDLLAELQLAGGTEEEGRKLATDYRMNTEKRWQDRYFKKLNNLLCDG